MAKATKAVALAGVATITTTASIAVISLAGSVERLPGGFLITYRPPRQQKLAKKVVSFTSVISAVVADSDEGGNITFFGVDEIDSAAFTDIADFEQDEDGFVTFTNEDGVETLVNMKNPMTEVSVDSERYDADGAAPTKAPAAKAEAPAAPAKKSTAKKVVETVEEVVEAVKPKGGKKVAEKPAAAKGGKKGAATEDDDAAWK